MYKCKCGETDQSKFYKSSKYYCKKCWNEKTYQAGLDKVNALKQEYGGKCKKCGYNKCVAALEFHHTNPKAKEFSLGKRRGLRIETLRKELDKCELICSNCHREIHANLEAKTK